MVATLRGDDVRASSFHKPCFATMSFSVVDSLSEAAQTSSSYFQNPLQHVLYTFVFLLFMMCLAGWICPRRPTNLFEWQSRQPGAPDVFV